ncbi:MAG: helicase-related protein, partial [Actinomycetota bacterium]|nr:helicase-related protein [Actinomycetota bacterium]
MQVFASFDEFFRTATGNDPYPYQRRVATEGDRLPDVIDIPPGLGKTAAVVLGWLWRRQLSGGPDTPRRLAFALPMRTLTRQTMGVIPEWLAKLGLSDEVALSQLVGGMASGGHGWRREPAKPLIIVGTVDMVLSRMLMRGYGSARNAYPVDAGLLWNDTHLVVDETQLAPASTVTARQLAAFQRQFGAMNSGLTCMSATVDADLLRTVDNPTIYDGEIVRLTEADHTPAVRRRLDASRTVRELSITQADPKAIAAAVIEHHRHGLTLVVLNTVGVAVDVFKRLIAKNSSLGDTPTILLHSRFRPADRDRSYDSLSEHSDVVVVATQVVEAGLDLNARTLITEAAPWASIIQRSGRCNRTGQIGDAELWWFASG